jgi:hypothetical protein
VQHDEWSAPGGENEQQHDEFDSVSVVKLHEPISRFLHLSIPKWGSQESLYSAMSMLGELRQTMMSDKNFLQP